MCEIEFQNIDANAVHGKGRLLTPTSFVLIGCNVFSLKFLVACMLGSGRPHVGHPH